MAIALGPSQLMPFLEGRFGVPLYLYAERCSSTQDLLPLDAPEGALAIAEEQLQGRGRRGRWWQAPPGTSLLFSVCLRPRVGAARLASLMPVAAEALVDALTAIGAGGATVKHPNDVLIGGRKVAGVVAEAGAGRVALGIGINVRQSAAELPERPIFPATSIALETGRIPDRAELLVRVLECLERHYDRWLIEPGA